MKKVKITTDVILSVYSILKGASYQKMSDDDKIKLWKIARALKPVATQFEEDNKDAAEKLKPEGFDERLQNAQEYERVTKDPKADTSALKMGAAEYNDFINGEWKKFNQLLAQAVDDFAKKEVTLEFEPLSEDAFSKLMASNDWKVDQVMTVADLIIN